MPKLDLNKPIEWVNRFGTTFPARVLARDLVGGFPLVVAVSAHEVRETIISLTFAGASACGGFIRNKVERRERLAIWWRWRSSGVENYSLIEPHLLKSNWQNDRRIEILSSVPITLVEGEIK